MWDFHSSFDKSHLIDGFNVWGKSSVDAENLAFNDSTNSEIIEHFCAVFPRVGIAVLSDSLIVKSIYSGNLSRLMVSSQKGDVGGVLQFQAEKQLERLHGVVSTIDEISHEDVSSVRDLTTLIK